VADPSRLAAARQAPQHGRERSGPRAPDGNGPLQVLVAETTIEQNKVAAIRNKTSASRVVEELLMAGRHLQAERVTLSGELAFRVSGRSPI
jgi:hypothetical protein